MNCPKCGEVCGCPMEPPPTALPISEPASATETVEGALSPPEIAAGETQDSAWRDELSARLSRYRSRRKAPPPRYPSLRLPFEAIETQTRGAEASPLSVFEPISSNALALDGMRQEPSVPEVQVPMPEEPAAESQPAVRSQSSQHPTAKIIEFPRFAWGPPPPPPDQLAEPVSDRPRILEVPECAPPPPALGGITIEPAEIVEAEKLPGIDFPLQSAPLGLRLLASLIDGVIIAAAAALFAFIFWKVTAVRPSQVQILGLAAGVLCLFWAAYQYLLIVYAANTPGLRISGLVLTRFDGTSTTRSLRRWRVLASCLSAVSLGMGYAWVFLDEDALCWHDRITHTHLAPTNSGRETKVNR